MPRGGSNQELPIRHLVEKLMGTRLLVQLGRSRRDEAPEEEGDLPLVVRVVFGQTPLPPPTLYSLQCWQPRAVRRA